ncbi:TnsD family Tn7-like transposition protein [Ramlibacter tataouinensis]|uniref:TnsD family Tn7-like transposition protein n=1 Tax=Ramlibacter tataouinensis TaxID=94132 RepID=UPI0022F38AF0|nr:TnsD family Tn7-like transposition protein [Ramlibacter tataouinensis]WBY03590.1 TnsD family Tn7-like transposition protein [Ramlibacter tataouinensis]
MEYHTVARYFCATLPPKRRDQFERRLAQVQSGPHRPLLPLAADEWFRPCAVVCPSCAQDSLRSNGFVCVQCAWLLPYLTRCPLHGQLLRHCPGWSARDPGGSLVPAHLRGRRQAAIELARMSVALLQPGVSSLLEPLIELLRERGFLTAGGQLRRSRLTELMQRRWEDHFEHPQLAKLFADPNRIAKALAPVAASRGTLHPLMGLLLLQALRELPKRPPAAPADTVGRGRRERLEQLRVHLERGGTPTQAARAAGVSVTTAVTQALALGKPVRLRPKTVLPAVRERVRGLLEQGLPIAQIARTAQVSLCSVYRILRGDAMLQWRRKMALQDAQLQRRRAAWLAAMAQCPQLTCTQLRRRHPATYAYLYRHDRAWLSQSTRKGAAADAAVIRPVSAPMRTPEGADELLAARIVALGCPAGPSARPHVTAAALMVGVGRPGLRLRPDATPQAAAAAALAIESRPQYLLRRLVAGAATARAGGWALKPWRVERLSGVRSSSLAASGVEASVAIQIYRAQAVDRLADGA